MNSAMKAIIIMAAILTISAVGIDLYTWQLVLEGQETYLSIWIQWSGYIRFMRTLVFSFVFISYLQLPHFTKDHTLMQSAMLVATIADFYLILQNRLIVGIAIFAIMQLILLYRHLQGFNWYLFRQKKYTYLTISLFAFAIVTLYLLHAPLSEKRLFWPVAGYGFLLIFSVLATAYSYSLGVLTSIQSKLALTGMIFFLICDITVGLGAVWSQQPAGYLVRALTGLVYTPALIFLSLSAGELSDIRGEK